MTRAGWFARTMPTSSRRLPRSVAPTKAIVPSSSARLRPSGDRSSSRRWRIRCARPVVARVAAAADLLAEQPLHQVEHGPHRAPGDRARAERRNRQQSHPVHRARVGGDGAPVRPEREVGQRDGEVPPLVLHAPPNGLLERLAARRGVRALRARHPYLPVHITQTAPAMARSEVPQRGVETKSPRRRCCGGRR